MAVLIGNVLDAFGDIDPAKIILKIKLHLLPHILKDIRRFGPAIRNSTEVFECFNAIFRLCSILSNHQAPSRDIATKFCAMDRLKHILSGGYWQQDGQWVQAGASVRRVLHQESVIQRHLGWVPPRKLIPGTIRLAGKQKSPLCSWDATLASKHYNAELLPFAVDTTPSVEKWHRGLSVVAQSEDVCPNGAWIFVRDHKVCTYWLSLSEI